MSFVKKHWLCLALIALFLFAVYSARQGIATIAAVALAVIAWTTGAVWWFWAVPIYALNFVFSFIPGSDGWYDWIPRSSNVTRTNLSASTK